MAELAIYGGKPVREDKICYGRQWITKEDIEAVASVLEGDLITCGPRVASLEKRLAKDMEAKYAVAVSSGTAALHCAMMAAGIQKGDEVITTPLTFAASANCALYCGATPVFADIREDTYNIDPESVKKLITDKTKAIVAVDFTGQAVMLDELKEICREHHLLLIEDAAHSIGTKYKHRMVGGIADMTCFSFHPVKTVTAGEGGAILTNDKSLYDKLMSVRTHGITKNPEDFSEEEVEGPWWYEQQELGYNYRITDFQAALLLSQLDRLSEFKRRRCEIVHAYDEAFKDVSQIILQKEISESDSCRHLYIIRLSLDKLSCSRREFFDAMSAENVQCQVHYIPVYWFPYYKKLGYQKGICPVAEQVYRGILSIPLYPKMTDDDVETVIKAVKKVIKYYAKA